MTTLLQFLIQSIPIFISIVVPGFLLALGLLRKTKLHLFEIFFIGIVFGITIPSLMSFVEFLVGIPFSLTSHLANLVIISIISIGIIIKDKIEILPKTNLELKTLYAFLILSIIIFLAWWIRVQALSPYFYEFDPYWYNTITEDIIHNGYVPPYSDNAWWPNIYSYRSINFVIVPYMEAGWYSIYTAANNVTGFDFSSMTMVSALYPALISALLCFFAYLWLSGEYGKAVGILAAGFLAFTPILVDKTLSGEFELQPWGLFSIVFFLAFYSLTLKTNSRKFAALTAFAIIIALLGSNASRLPVYFAIAISLVFTLIKFMKNDLNLDFIYLNAIIMGGVAIGILISYPYIVPVVGSSVDTSGIALLILSLGSVAGMYILYYLKPETKNAEEKLLYLSVLFIVALVIVTITPLGQALSEINALVTGVTSYTDPTFQTIAEQTVSVGGLHSALGILGYDISDFSISYVILALATIVIILALVSEINIYLILALIIVLPLSLTGLFKVKYTPYTGLFLPILLCFMVGVLYINKNLKRYNKYILGIVSILILTQVFAYYDLISSSLGNHLSLDISNNSAISDFCNKQYQEIVSVANNGSFLIGANLTEMVINSKSETRQIYCNHIPEHWLNSMYWLRNNTSIDDRTICWWDYGHWITTFGQRKSVTDNTHVYTLMHQEVADKIVYNTPEALRDYMSEHKAKYLLLDEDLIGGIGRSDSLIGKWGALVYHACYFNNKTDIKNGPGGSDCDKENYPEILYIPLPDQQFSLSSEHICNNLINGKKAAKIYSPYFGQKYKFDYYCMPIDSLKELIGTLQYKLSYDGIGYVPISVKYENGKDAGINNGLFRSVTSDNYLVFIATYPSDNPDKKGKFYDSVFYKGFFEGNVPGFEQIYPQKNLPGPSIPVRIYTLSS